MLSLKIGWKEQSIHSFLSVRKMRAINSQTKDSYSRFYTDNITELGISNWCAANQRFASTSVMSRHIMVSVLFFTVLNLLSLCYCLSTALPLSFPVTGNSHNCRPKRLSVCRRQRGQAWLRLNAQFQGEFVSHGQTKDAVPHHRGATYTANRRSRTWMQLSPEPCLWSWQLGKNVRPTTAANQGWLIWSFPFMSFKVLLVTAQTAGRQFLWPQGSSGSLWRTWKVGLDGWWDKPDQTLLLRLDTQTWESGRCRCLLPVTNFWIVQEAEPSKLLLNNPRGFFFFFEQMKTSLMTWQLSNPTRKFLGTQKLAITDYGFVLKCHRWDSWRSVRGSAF